MRQSRWAVAAVVVACVLAAGGGQARAPFKAAVIVADSEQAIEQWVLQRVKDGDAPAPAVVRVQRNRMYWFPALVTGYPQDPKRAIRLTADVTFIGPDGKTRFEKLQMGRANRQDPRTPGVIVLSPVFNLQFDAGDAPGRYRVEVVVREGPSTEKAVVTLELE